MASLKGTFSLPLCSALLASTETETETNSDLSSSCYGANSLEDTEILGDAMCDIPCPGDARLICGGRRSFVPRRRDLELSRRAAPADILLTAYALIINDDNVSESSRVGDSDTALPESASSSATTATTTDAGGPPQNRPRPSTEINSDDPTRTIVTTVITVVYTVVDARNPANLIATEFHTTIVYLSGHDRVPSVEMTLTEASCDACGPGGADVIELTVPATPPTETEAATTRADSMRAGSENLGDGPDYPGSEPQSRKIGNEAGYPDREPQSGKIRTKADDMATNLGSGSGSLAQTRPTRLGDSYDSPDGGQPGQACRTCGIVSGAHSGANESGRGGPQTGKIPFGTARPEVVLAGSLQKSAGYISLGLVSLVIGLLIVV